MGFLDLLQFANKTGLYALLSIIPLIIIYLLRPRPTKINIPSLMFLMEIEKKKRRFNIFRKFIKDPLFLMQLLVLTLISFAIASPFIIAQQESGEGNTAIIIDGSASMQADGNFKKAINEAKKYLTSSNTIILAENIPILVIKDAPKSSSSDALDELTPKSTTSDLSSAILLAKRMLPESGKIVVFSDFASFSGQDPNIAKAVAKADGLIVEFVKIRGRTDNIGIVDGWFEQNGNYKIRIKNYNKNLENINLKVTTNNKNIISESISLNPESSMYFVISNLEKGITKIQIDTNDALAVDDIAYVIIPKAIEKDILYITNNSNSPSIAALKLLPNLNLEISQNLDINQHSIIFINTQIGLDTEKKLSEFVKNGGTLVVIASDNMKNTDFLPVELDGIANKTSLNLVTQTKITQGIDFDKIVVNKHYKAKGKTGAVTLIKAGDDSVMLNYWRFGKGFVIYDGLADPSGDNIYDPLNKNVWNSFHAIPEYPLFWNQLIEWITKSYDISEYNVKTGKLIKFASTQTVKTPNNKVTTDVLLFDETGIYELSDREIAVNLYDEKESNIANEIKIETLSQENNDFYSSTVIRKPKYFDIYLIILAMFFIFLELYYLRWRGEL